MRGKRGFCFCNSSTKGLIPACAGKTFPQRAEARSQWAHPRVCGENHSRVDGTFTKLGSSPRVRGKPTGALALARVVGLIPACAGKTLARLARFKCAGAHPRVCGENAAEGGEVHANCGSSPRVRGKLVCFSLCLSFPGLIPACAGKTRNPRRGRKMDEAHPRVCGEN